MNSVSHSRRNIFFTLVCIISLVGYGFFVFAAPPGPGGYNPGETLDPECTPGQLVPEPCIVQLSSGGSFTADNGLTITGSNVQLGGTLLQDTVIDQDGFNQEFLNGNFKVQKMLTNNLYTGFENGDDVLGTGLNGNILYSMPESSFNPSLGLMALYMDYQNQEMVLTSSDYANNKYSNIGFAGFSQIEIQARENDLNSRTIFDPGITTFNASDNSLNNSAGIELNHSGGISFNFSNSNIGSSYTFPRIDGTVGQVLATDGSGVISWQNAGGSGWSLTGDAGTTPGTNFLGTTDNKDLIFKTNNVQTGFISDDGLSIQFGSGAGSGSAAQSYTTYIGVNSGFGATGTSFSNFIGVSSGYQATNVIHSNFMGSAGFAATNADHSNFFGNQAGYQAVNASNSNFFGNQAGYQDGFIGAPVVNNSNFFGQEAGKFATNSSYSNFFGYRTGNGATNAANSIFIGSSAGYGDTVDNTTDPDDYSILIGNNSGTNGYENSIALGQRATNTASNQFMIGSATRPINEVIIRGAGASCTIDNNIYGDGSTGLNCSSDERLKTNITPLSSVIDTLSHVETVTYNWKANPTGTQQIGFLAQNLEQYYPQLVQQGFDGYYQVNYAAMTPILVEAIRELNMKVTNLALLTAGSADSETFKNSLRTWFADAGNGITDFFTKTSHTETLCVGTSGNETCITKSQLDQLLNPQTIIQPSGDPETFDEPTPSDPEPDSTETSDTGSDESQDSTPVSNDTNS